MISARTTGTVVALFLTIAVVNGQPPPVFRDVETRVLAARRAIRSGHLVVESSTISEQQADGPIAARTRKIQSRYEFWMAADRLRLRVRHVEDGITAPAYEQLECANFDGRGKDFRYDGDPKAVAYQGRGMRDAKGLHEVFDPRLIGYICNDLNSLRYRGYTFDDIFGGPTVVRQDVRCETKPYDGDAAIRVSWARLPSKDHVARGYTRPTLRELWVSPAKGYNILRSASWETDPAGQEDWRYEITNTLAQFDGIWFVAESHVRKTSGPRSTETETVRVTQAEFNRPGADEAFEMRNFGLRPGQGIWDKDLKKRIIFDGEHVRVNVEEELARAATDAVPLAPIPGSTNYWLVALCVGAAAVGSALLFRLLPRRR